MESSASEAQYFFYLGNGAGITILDVLLLVLCPVATMLGTMVANSVSKIVNKPEYEPATELPPHLVSKLNQEGGDEHQMLAEYNADLREWYSLRMARENRINAIRLPFVGLVLGLVIALYFVGAITNDVTSLARILGLCVLLGYQAPNLWINQEKAIKRLVDRKIESLLGKGPNQ
ncbi:hypothetical protein ACLD0W_14980 [Alloalcanivorax sp. C16-1]|uniref:hypothetical protein n=1 Tax=Alloalcanivorax sp. C16-1 TaxID=3390051 RepID=UPI00397116C3